jgi:hypothetical protein
MIVVVVTCTHDHVGVTIAVDIASGGHPDAEVGVLRITFCDPVGRGGERGDRLRLTGVDIAANDGAACQSDESAESLPEAADTSQRSILHGGSSEGAPAWRAPPVACAAPGPGLRATCAI